MGAGFVDDMHELTEQELQQLGMKKLEARRLLRSLPPSPQMLGNR
jgi:hypothetical protein